MIAKRGGDQERERKRNEEKRGGGGGSGDRDSEWVEDSLDLRGKGAYGDGKDKTKERQ